jgi:hypothetical protein
MSQVSPLLKTEKESMTMIKNHFMDLKKFKGIMALPLKTIPLPKILTMRTLRICFIKWNKGCANSFKEPLDKRYKKL